MKLFTTLFNIAVLPVKLAADVVMLIPDLSLCTSSFSRTEEQCQKIDEGIK